MSYASVMAVVTSSTAEIPPAKRRACHSAHHAHHKARSWLMNTIIPGVTATVTAQIGRNRHRSGHDRYRDRYRCRYRTGAGTQGMVPVPVPTKEPDCELTPGARIDTGRPPATDSLAGSTRTHPPPPPPCQRRQVAMVKSVKQVMDDLKQQSADERQALIDRTPVEPQPEGAFQRDFQSGRRQLAKGQLSGKWPDGRRIGRGFASPYLQYKYAQAMAERRKTVEGRPGGGWLERGGTLIQPDDYINFKIPGKWIIKSTLRIGSWIHDGFLDSRWVNEKGGERIYGSKWVVLRQLKAVQLRIHSKTLLITSKRRTIWQCAIK